MRMAELLRTVDGDCGWLRLASGQVQLIEGDRIRNPLGITTGTQWRNGVEVDRYGKPIRYAVHERLDGGSSFLLERYVSARNMRLHGYFDREDQERGVSPLASAYNELQDVYEIHDLARARTKVQSFFAVAFFRQAEESAGDLTGGTDDDDQEDKSGYEVDFGKGPAIVDLDPGDEMKFLESGQPSTQVQAFVESVLLLALKALDLPYSFLREDFTNFFGSRGAWLLYDRACEPKREENQEVLDDWTVWKATQWIIRGDLVLPAGVTLEDQPWEWVPRKVPAFKRIEDVKADILALGAGLTNPEGICREDDEGSFRENIADIAEALDYAREKGVNVVWALQDNPELPDEADSEDAGAVPGQDEGSTE
jgi:capsid protein